MMYNLRIFVYISKNDEISAPFDGFSQMNISSQNQYQERKSITLSPEKTLVPSPSDSLEELWAP